MVQSYHSTALPTLPAMIARRRVGAASGVLLDGSFMTVLGVMRAPYEWLRVVRCGGPGGRVRDRLARARSQANAASCPPPRASLPSDPGPIRSRSHDLPRIQVAHARAQDSTTAHRRRA